MPESVDRPAPDRTRTSPSATRSASSSRPGTAVRGGSTAGRAALTGPWSPATATCAATSDDGGQLPLEPAEQVVVDPAQALGREGPLEEAADAPGAVPGGAHPHGAAVGAGRDDGPGGDHRRAGVALDERPL